MMDEFELFRARAFGCREPDDCGEGGGGGRVGTGSDDSEGDQRVGSCRQRQQQSRCHVDNGQNGSGLDSRGSSDDRHHYNDRFNPNSAPASWHGRGGHEHRADKKRRLNTQVTVSVEPPSPTELTSGTVFWGPQDSDDIVGRSSHHRRPSSTGDGNRHDYDDPGESVGADESRGLQRTRTMPARRSRSPSTGHSHHHHHHRPRSGVRDETQANESTELSAAADDVDDDDSRRMEQPSRTSLTSSVSAVNSAATALADGLSDVPGGREEAGNDDDDDESKIVRVRSFSTRPGGSVVNKGDSIKVCSRRGSRQEVLLLTAPSDETNLRRRNSTNSALGGSRRGSVMVTSSGFSGLPSASGLGGGGLQPEIGGLLRQRRNSVNCLGSQLTATAANNSTSFTNLGSGSGRRKSLLPSPIADFIASVSGDDVSPTPTIVRRPSIRATGISGARRQSQISLNGVTGSDVNASADGENFGIDAIELDDGDPESNPVESYRVLVIGGHGVGKTTLTRQLMTSEYLANRTDNEQDDDTTDHVVSVQLDDVESMVQFDDNHNPDTDMSCLCTDDTVNAFLVVYSVTDRSSFSYAQSFLQELKRQRLLKTRATLLVANKQDLVRNRAVSESDGKKLSSKRHCKFIEVSALLDHKVDEVLVSIIRQARQQRKSTSTVAAAGFLTGNGAPQSDDDQYSNGRGNLKGCFHRASVAFCRKLFK